MCSKILKNKLNGLKHNLTDDELNDIAQNCHGYVGADLDMLVKEAGLSCVKRVITAESGSDCSIGMNDTKSSVQAGMMISSEDLKAVMRKIKPSAMREITFDIPRVKWEQIGGQHELKKKLKQAIVWPIKHGEAFKRLNIRPPRGILMYGPPGCSKTMIGKISQTIPDVEQIFRTHLDFVNFGLKPKRWLPRRV